jgi:type II secretory pathway pseudopilin PulG
MGIRLLSGKRGFTLIEVVISCLLIVIAFVSFQAIICMQQYFFTYSKHKLQAVHAARTVLDMQRVAGFPYIVNGSFQAPVYGGCDLTDAAVTVTVLPPYDDAPMAYRKTVKVTVSWKEKINGILVNKQEVLTTDIANEPQLN